MSYTWHNDCQVPASGTPAASNTNAGTDAIVGGTNLAISGVSVPAGNTFVVDTAVHPTIPGKTLTQSWHCTQNGTGTTTAYADGSAAVSGPYRWVESFRLEVDPVADFTPLRFYPDLAHTVIAFSCQVTNARKIRVAEAGHATSPDSTGVLTVDVDYDVQFDYDPVADTATLAFYTPGTSTIVAQATLTGVVGTYALRSCRFTLGTSTGVQAFSGQGYWVSCMGMGDTAVLRPSQVVTRPVANAGTDLVGQEVLADVSLDASNSTDASGGTNFSCLWTPPAGITLSDPTAVQPIFTTPGEITDMDYDFTLVVTDNATGVQSLPDVVRVSVNGADRFYIDDTGVWIAYKETAM